MSGQGWETDEYKRLAALRKQEGERQLVEAGENFGSDIKSVVRRPGIGGGRVVEVRRRSTGAKIYIDIGS